MESKRTLSGHVKIKSIIMMYIIYIKKKKKRNAFDMNTIKTGEKNECVFSNCCALVYLFSIKNT